MLEPKSAMREAYPLDAQQEGMEDLQVCKSCPAGQTRIQLLHQVIDQLHIPLHYPAKRHRRQSTALAILPFLRVRTGDGLVLRPHRVPQLFLPQDGNLPIPSHQTSSSQPPLRLKMPHKRSLVAALQSNPYMYGATPRNRHMTIYGYQEAPISKCFRPLHG